VPTHFLSSLFGGLARRGGTIVFNGLPPGDFPAPIFDIVLKGLTIRGSIVGTRQDMAAALDFYARGLIHPTWPARDSTTSTTCSTEWNAARSTAASSSTTERANDTGLTRRTRCTIAPSSNQPVV
jgi:threonine dehydrogenase-like Zn-dependent dehydrogenase